MGESDPHLQPIAPDRTAVVVVDVQNDFCTAGGRAEQHGRSLSDVRAVIPRIAGLLDAARAKGVLVVYLQNTTLADGRLSSPADVLRRKAEWGDADPFPTLEGTWGHAIVDELTPGPEDVLIRKIRQSGFIATNLDLTLRGCGRSILVFAGVATHACVEATLRDALNRDYVTLLLEDCVAALERPLHKAAMEVLSAILPREWVMESRKFLERLEGKPVP
jgi:ureidoacrylate peracid hydrolase